MFAPWTQEARQNVGCRIVAPSSLKYMVPYLMGGHDLFNLVGPSHRPPGVFRGIDTWGVTLGRS
jgi:hypothetical protein